MTDLSPATSGALLALCVRHAGLLDWLSLQDAARLRQASRAIRLEVDAVAPLPSLGSARRAGHLPWSSARAAVAQMAAQGYPPRLSVRLLEQIKPSTKPPELAAIADLLVWPDGAENWHASLSDCPSLRTLPLGLSRSSALRELRLCRLPALVALPEDLDGLANLATLAIEDVPALRRLPAALGTLTGLRRLRLMACGLVSLPAEIGALGALIHLHVDAPALEHLPDGIGQLASLRDLQLSAPRLRELPATLAGLTALECAKLACGQLRRLPDALAALPRLQVIGLHGCVALTALPGGLADARAGRPLNFWISGDPPAVADDGWPQNVYVGRTTCSAFW